MEKQMTNSSTREIINAALQDDPLTIRNTIETVIAEKIANALEEKKAVIAYNLIGMQEQKDKSQGKDGPTKHPDFGGKSAHSKPPYHTKNESVESEQIDYEEFKQFLSEQLEIELDDEDMEYLLEDMDDETMEEILTDYNAYLIEGKKN